MSVAANQSISRQAGCRRHHPVAVTTHLYQGTLGFINVTGYLDDDTASGANKFAGVVLEEKDNGSGAAGDLKAEVYEDGEYPFAGTGFTQASVGKDAYATDNFTVSAGYAANGVKIGTIVEFISTTKVVVRIDVHAQRQGEVIAIGGGLKLARGQSTTVAASDTIATGLATVVAVIAVLNDAPVAGCQFVTADVGDQAGAPVAGSFLLKTWKATAAGDTTQIAASTFTKKVNWVAIGT